MSRRPYIFEEDVPTNFLFDIPFIIEFGLDQPGNAICTIIDELVKTTDDCFVTALQRNVTTLAGEAVCNIATDPVIHNG